MFRLAAVVYIVVSTVIMGMGVTAVLATPSLADEFTKWIIVSSAVGAVLGLPISYWVAKAVNAQIKR